MFTLGVADDPVCVVDTFAPPGLRQHPLSGDIRKFQKEHFAEDKNGSVRVDYIICLSLVSREPSQCQDV